VSRPETSRVAVTAGMPHRSGPSTNPLATALGLSLLATTDLLLLLAPFSVFYQFIRSFPVRQCDRDPAPVVARTCRTLDRAASCYFKRAWCLQRSAATVLLLRFRGVPAQLVIGVERVPFYAHAWVEVAGRVVNDNPEVTLRCSVLERC
jgi:transglutaminase-like putative cysteine protease